jgi:phosphoserine phosphatase RsbU/P
MIKHIKRFWLRITNGMALGELWKQFRADTRLSYRLYSQDVEIRRQPGTGRIRHFFRVANQFFWAIVDKLTPARRVLLVLALILLVTNVNISCEGSGHQIDTVLFLGPLTTGEWGVLLLLLVLVLEVTDRVVMKRDLQIAKEIQSWLLPSEPPAVPGVEIAFATRAANTVAGDYYDVFPRTGADAPGGTYLMAIADVAGKSVPAAMLMATYQASLKTLAATSSSPAELVSRMNQYSCLNSQNGRRFTTTFVAEYDPASRRLVYVNAGHNPPILRRTTGAIERLTEGGLPLGIEPEAKYESGTATLESGDWLVIYTDGVTEAENTSTEEFGETRLMVTLNVNAAATPATLLNGIMMDIDRFVGDAPQHDDITLLLVKVD